MKSLNPSLPKGRHPRLQPGSGRRDTLLDCLTRRQAGEVRRIVVDCHNRGARRIRRVRVGPAGEVARSIGQPPCAGGWRCGRGATSPAAVASASGRGEQFHFLRDAEAKLRVVAEPQTIVFSILPPQQAGGVLAQLQPRTAKPGRASG